MGALSDTQLRHRLGFRDLSDALPHSVGLSRNHPDRLEVIPFSQFTKIESHPSFGLGSYGIDLRMGYQFKYLDPVQLLARGIPYVRPGMKGLPWTTVELNTAAADQQLMVIPPKGFILAQTLEYVRIPRDCWGIVMGKSTWARLGIDLNTTPIEPEWCGYITIEITNNAPFPVAIEAEEGFCQLVLFRGDRPEMFPLGKSYADRANPTYQNQTGVAVATA